MRFFAKRHFLKANKAKEDGSTVLFRLSVSKKFLTRSQTRPATLGSRLKRLRLAAAHSLTLARLRAEKYFCRCTCHRQKCFKLSLRLRAQTLRGFWNDLPAPGGPARGENHFYIFIVPLTCSCRQPLPNSKSFDRTLLPYRTSSYLLLLRPYRSIDTNHHFLFRSMNLQLKKPEIPVWN